MRSSPSLHYVDLNGDIGEYFAASANHAHNDEALVGALTSANIACGFHAGDPLTMRRTVARCLSSGVVVGAHPSYPDLAGFGRRHLAMTHEELAAAITYQIAALAGIAKTAGTSMKYVKAHGALYNRTFADEAEAAIVVDAVAGFDPLLTILGQPQSALEAISREKGISFAREGFADRRYDEHGALIPRDDPRAMITDPSQQMAQALALATGSPIECLNGRKIRLEVDSICVHGDSPAAAAAAVAIRRAMQENRITVASFC